MIGSLELRFRLTPNGGDPVDTVSTPAMFARADEWIDSVKATGSHTDAWIASKFLAAIAVQAMQHEGLVPMGHLSTGLIATALNVCDFEVIDEDREAAGENPTPTAPAPGQGAGAVT